jgi:hypothetical protein
MISLIHRWIFGPKSTPMPIDLPGYGIVECTQCHKYLRHKFALSLMSRLEKDHQMHEDAAIDTAVHMLELLAKEKRKYASHS